MSDGTALGHEWHDSMNCFADVDIRAPNLVMRKVADLHHCVRLCEAHATCATFIHNRYGECYLRRQPGSQTAVVSDAHAHQTVSCVLLQRVPDMDLTHLHDRLTAVRRQHGQEHLQLPRAADNLLPTMSDWFVDSLCELPLMRVDPVTEGSTGHMRTSVR